MRRFSSYGPIDTDLNYYVPRRELVEKGYTQLVGETPLKGGHYFTVWAPRQCGKTWIMQEAVKLIRKTGLYDVAICSVGRAKDIEDEEEVMKILIEKLRNAFGISFPLLTKISDFSSLFTRNYFKKPVILVFDEFDALDETLIHRFANIFRELYIERTNEQDRAIEEKTCLLHGLALIGVRSVLGIENATGSPFNVQRSLRIPNLELEEVESLFKWYEKESGQSVKREVIDSLYKEVGGQPGLTCWFGELLTEGIEHYVNDRTKPIDRRAFEIVYSAATYILPNNNILNLISKAKEEFNRELILKMFQTDKKIEFKFDDKTMNWLYMNGLVQYEIEDGTRYYLKFSCSFVQKRLFNYFSNEYFGDMGNLTDALMDIDDIVTPTGLDIFRLMRLYQDYLDKNKSWLFKKAPRRSDERVFEAVFHFNIYSYLRGLLLGSRVDVVPEFPTGNGKIDLLIFYNDCRYGIELKSFSNKAAYRNALVKAAHYGKQLGLSEIFLVSFIESIEEEKRSTYEQPYVDSASEVTVKPFFIQTGMI